MHLKTKEIKTKGKQIYQYYNCLYVILHVRYSIIPFALLASTYILTIQPYLTYIHKDLYLT